MNSHRAAFWFVTVLLLAALACVVVQQIKIARLRRENAALAAKAAEVNQLFSENTSLQADLKRMAEQTDAGHRELLRLRANSSALRDKDKEIAGLKADRDRIAQQLQTAAPAPAAQPVPEDSPERQRTIARLSFSKQLGLSLVMAAADNQRQWPPNLDAIEGKYLQRTPDMDAHNIQVAHFELLCKGRLDDVPEPARTVLAREKKPSQRADGRWEQVYVFVDGHAEVLSAATSAELSQKEKEQFVLPKTP